MSGFTFTTGQTDARAGVEAAPHRGNLTAHLGGDGWSAAIQAHPNCPETYLPFLELLDGVVVCGVGAVWEGSDRLVGVDAASAVLSRWRDGTLKDINGMISGVVFADGAATGFRAWPGEMPLYGLSTGSVAAFATEVKQVAAVADPGPKNVEACRRYIELDIGEDTGYRDVKRCFPGVHTTARDGLVADCVVAPEVRINVDFETAALKMRRLLEQAVARRYAPNSSISVSGGHDSPTVAACWVDLARSRGDAEPVLISNAFPEQPSCDETEMTRSWCESIGVSPTFLDFAPHSPIPRDVARLHDGQSINAMVQPLFEPVNRESARRGCAVEVGGYDAGVAWGIRPGWEPELARMHPAGWWRIGKRYGVSTPRRVLRFARAVAGPRSRVFGILDQLRGRHKRIDVGTAEASVPRLFMSAAEEVQRIALLHHIHLVWPLCDSDLLRYSLTVKSRVHVEGGYRKALARRAFPEMGKRWGESTVVSGFGDAVEACGTAGMAKEALERWF